MSFAEEMRKEGNFTRTENGAVALNTTGDACLDLFSTIGSLRTANEERLLQRLYSMQEIFVVVLVKGKHFVLS